MNTTFIKYLTNFIWIKRCLIFSKLRLKLHLCCRPILFFFETKKNVVFTIHQIGSLSGEFNSFVQRCVPPLAVLHKVCIYTCSLWRHLSYSYDSVTGRLVTDFFVKLPMNISVHLMNIQFIRHENVFLTSCRPISSNH